MAANKASKLVWMYQTAEGTATLDAADDKTFYFLC